MPEAAITRVDRFSYLIHVVLAVFYSSSKPIVLRKSEAKRLYIFIKFLVSKNMSKMKTNDMSADAPTYLQGNGMSIRKSPIRNQGK